MLFTPSILLAGGATIVLACLDKTLNSYGYHTVGNVLRILLPIAGFVAGVYFLETNAIIGWLK